MNRKSGKTILAVSGDVDVLVLMKGMLENDYRVLVAADADRALRLVTIAGIHVDLAVVDRNIVGGRRDLLRRMANIFPTLRTVPMASLVQDGVIRLQAFGALNKRRSGGLLQGIRIVLGDESRCSKTALPTSKQVASTAKSIGTKAMVAGRA